MPIALQDTWDVQLPHAPFLDPIDTGPEPIILMHRLKCPLLIRPLFLAKCV